MFFIILLGIILRLIFIDKAEGLWNDEYVSWMVSAVPLNHGFWGEVLKQCHMPLYYIYLKPFSALSDVCLRLTSVVPSVISIWIMYLIGKEYSKKTAIIAALISSVLSFLVYYAQEVRFYSLLFLLSALSLLFTIKLVKNYSTKILCFLVISNVLILFTHILGIIYVFFNVCYVSGKLSKNNEQFRKIMHNPLSIIFSCIVLFLIILLGLNIIKQMPSSQWWGHFSYTNVMFLFSDYFSPILTNHINAPSQFFYNKSLMLQMTIPSIIAICGIICAFISKRCLRELATIALLTLLVLFLLAGLGKIVFVTKYSIEILPIFILMLSIGLLYLKKFGYCLLVIFLLFHLSLVGTPNYVTNTHRSEGNKTVGDILNSRQPDKVIFTYYAPDRFYRYWQNKQPAFFISKINRFDYLDNPSKILDNVKSKETVSVVFLDSVSFFSEEYIAMYKESLPEMFVTFSHIKNVLIKELNDNYYNYKVDIKGSWTVITAQKK